MGQGWSRLARRLYRLRLWSGFLPAAPALFLVLWYSGAALVAHARHNGAVGQDRALTWELFQLHLHDSLTRDLRTLDRRPPGSRSKIPALSLALNVSALRELADSDSPEEGAGAYVEGTLRLGRDTYRVKVRHRGGDRSADSARRSWKVRVQDGLFVQGLRTFNLVNTTEPLSFDEQIVLDVCREQGLLAPAQFPVRLRLDGVYVGVYSFLGQPDGDLLRAGERVPGALYSGNEAPVDPATGVSRLWESSDYWKKVARADHLPADSTAELDELLRVVARGTPAEFARFARDHLDLDKLALFDAIDVVFGGNQHDFGRNQKLLFDPYRGRFEAVAWDFSGWGHARTLNRAENPLLLRLKELPEYLTRRNRTVWSLLAGSCSVEAVRRRALQLARDVGSEEAADPYWEASDMLPPGDRYFTRMVRPMTVARQRVALEGRLEEYERRAAFLTAALSEDGLEWTLRGGPAGALLEAVVDGPAGYRLERLAPEWPAGCRPAAWRVRADRDLDGGRGEASDVASVPALGAAQPATLDLPLYPGTVLEARPEVHPTRGAVVSKVQPRRYRLLLDGGTCAPEAVVVRAVNLVTGRVAEARVEPAAAPASDAAGGSCADPGPGFLPGRASIHPWCYAPPVAAAVRLGPGRVEVDRSRVFGPGERLILEPGTTLVLGEGVSLVARGGLEARGTASAPIRFEPRDRAWGGLAILGASAAGSVLEQVEFRGGTAADPAWTVLPGTVNVQDTQDVRFTRCRFESNGAPDEVFHAAYVRGLVLEELEIRGAPADAVDLEFVEARVQGLTVVDAGQEALDLMGGNVALLDSRVLDCGGNGISAGFGAELAVADTIVAGSRVGLLVKSGSRVRVERSLFYDDAMAAVLRVSGEHRPGRSRLETDEAWVAGCTRGVRVEDGSPKAAPAVRYGLPAPALPGLRERVLGLAEWLDLPRALDRLRRGGS